MSFENDPAAPDGLSELVAPPQFGVDGAKQERDWPLMTRAEVSTVLSAYRLGEQDAAIGPLTKLSWHSPRPFSAAVLANTARGDALFVKRHHIAIRDLDGLHEEHRFIAHLRSRGVPVASVLGTADGATAIQRGNWSYEVHTLAPGVDAYRGTMSWMPFSHVSHAYAAGRTLARLHHAAADYVAPPRTAKPLLQSFQVLGTADLLLALERWIAPQPLLTKALARRSWQADIAECIGPFHAQLVPLLPALKPLWTHGDWHASNLLWTGGDPGAQVRTILDFGLSDRTCAVYDLALAIERNCIAWLSEGDARHVYTDHIDALLTGYESLAPLTDDEYAALIALLPIVHTEFALSELGYFEDILGVPATADVAYDVYLLGHARWFAQASGRALIDWLRIRPRFSSRKDI